MVQGIFDMDWSLYKYTPEPFHFKHNQLIIIV
jgi:hypothetical protein